MEKLAKYLLVVRMDVDPEKEKQFNEWYNQEHIPALLEVPGVIRAYRYIALEGTPKYIAIYELNEANVPNSEAWQNAVELTPRPEDVASKNVSRNLYECIYPEQK